MTVKIIFEDKEMKPKNLSDVWEIREFTDFELGKCISFNFGNEAVDYQVKIIQRIEVS